MTALSPLMATRESLPRILVVDDEPHVAQGVRNAMRRRADVVCAESGAAALIELENAAPFDVVLTDLRMPGMDGNELLRRARERFPNVVRLMWSGQADLVAATEAINGGGIFRFLLKPCNGAALEDALFAAVGERRRQDHERAIALEDPMLKIGTRRAFDAALQDAMVRASSGEVLSVAMIDVDEFKKYNDHYGHVAGDGALKTVAATLRTACEGRAGLYRYGGEELVVIAALSAAALGALVEGARAALDQVAEPHVASGLGRLTFSSGVASFQADRGSPVERADQALYQSKTCGRNRVTVGG